MFDWLSEQYVKLIANYRILLSNPVSCATVDLLRLFTFTLLVVFAIRLAIHLALFYRLKRRSLRYSDEHHSKILELYQSASEKVGLRQPPPLYQFRDEKPLIFTIGCYKPVIFMAPSVMLTLPDDELEAVFVHELTHIRRGDGLLIWLLEIFLVSIPVLIVQVFALSFVFSVQNSVYAILGTLGALTLFKGFLLKGILFLRELSCDDLSVEVIHDPLTLASSLIRVWRLGREVPNHRWQTTLTFGQSFLPASRLEYRVRRLLEYRRSGWKFVIGRLTRATFAGMMIFAGIFLWWFYSTNRHVHWQIDNDRECFYSGYL